MCIIVPGPFRSYGVPVRSICHFGAWFLVMVTMLRFPNLGPGLPRRRSSHSTRVFIKLFTNQQRRSLLAEEVASGSQSLTSSYAKAQAKKT